MITNWFVRGDTHGNFTWMSSGCLKDLIPEETGIIILGDAGFNFFLNERDDRTKAEVNGKGYRFYCVRGNHEARPQNVSTNYELQYDPNVGGNVYIEARYPNIRFFKDWGQYWIGGHHTAVIGGAYSVDKWYRLKRVGVFGKNDYGYNNPKKTGWFPDEQLSAEERDAAMAELSGKHFDFVFTHTCPISWQPTDLFLSFINQSNVDNSMEQWLEEVKNNISWGIWCFGHYHKDRLERPYVEQYFNDVESLSEINARWVVYKETGKLDWWLSKSPNFYMV